MSDLKQKPIVLGITGASGSIYGFSLLKFFLASGFKVDLVLSGNSKKVAREELDFHIIELSRDALKEKILDFTNCQDCTENLTIHDHGNVAATISSGSYQTQGMIIAPCSMGTIGNIAAGTSNNLIARAADVVLKERRKLVLLAREAPFNTIHLRNMTTLSEMGAVVMPAAPGFYHNPESINDMVNFVLGKTLDVFGIDNEMFKRWAGEKDNQLLNA